MSISFYDLSVATYLQVLGGVAQVLEKGAAHCEATGLAPAEIVNASLASDMAPFSFQVRCVAHHSLGALDGVRSGEFRPPGEDPGYDYSGLQELVAQTHSALQAADREAVDALEQASVTFKLAKVEIPFTAPDFVLSFSLPNLFFHATTAYDILRARGAPLGKRDFLGPMRIATGTPGGR